MSVGETTGHPASCEVELKTDNKAARDLAYNPEHHERTKHIERRHFYIRGAKADRALRQNHGQPSGLLYETSSRR